MLHADDDIRTVRKLELPNEAATLALGARLAVALSPGLVIYLCGDLGSGKTTLVRGLLRALGYEGKVKSPTYTLVELYVISGLNLHHFDFYRFIQPEEYLDAGLDEYFRSGAVCLVEWPEKAEGYLAPADMRIALSLARDGRDAEVTSLSAAGFQCLKKLQLPAPA